MLKVIHVVNTGKYSGAESVAISTIEALRKQVQFVYVCLEGPVTDILESKGIDYICVSKLKVKEIARIIKKVKPDIIHAHDYTAGIVCALSFTRVPIINHIHNNAPWIKKVNIKSISYAISSLRYNKIIVVSDSIIKEHFFGAILSKKAVTIRNPFDLPIVQERANNDITDKESYDIVYLGRLSEAKNPIGFVEIMKMVSEKYPSVRIAMIGDGELKAETINVINRFRLDGEIKMLGHKDNPYPYLKDAKVLCVPSKWEGYGIAATEALALGVPVVARQVGGLTDIVNEECGFLCCNDKEIADKIILILRDRDLQCRLSNGALRRAEEIEKESNYFEQISALYIRTVKYRE